MSNPDDGPESRPGDEGLESRPGDGDVEAVVERVGRLDLLAGQVAAFDLPEGPARERARQLRDHVAAYLLPRARSLDTPLVVVLLGPTGAGKSTLMNTLAGARVSQTGVLRPTTRRAVLVATLADADALLESGTLSRLPQGRVEHVEVGARAGLALIDAPDLDSIEHENRVLADFLLEAADLCVFVTTATRYADRVPWDVLGRIGERRLSMVVVVNRLPPEEADAALVIEDVRRLFVQAGVADLEVLPVREGELAGDIDGLRSDPVAPLLTRIDDLAHDREARRSLAAAALAGAVAGVVPLVHSVADDLEHRAIDAEALRRVAAAAFAEEERALIDEVRGGRFLREEVLRQWHSFVGADQITRMFSSGIGRVRGTLVALVRGTPPPPVAVVEEQATDDLVAAAVAHAGDAARRTASRWSEHPIGEHLVAYDPGLWAVSPEFAPGLQTRVADWLVGIARDVRELGASKRSLARGAAFGLNAVGVTVMLSVFAHTGGLTGAEAGVAAATAFLNQKLLNALFGEAAVIEMVDGARRRLAETIAAAMTQERGRYDALAPDPTALRAAASDLRSVVSELTP